jgi:peptidoglycan hydrolase-like protein with peptidoglycan-binding domain
VAIDLITRKEWGARAPKGSYTTLRSTQGVKVHYTGSKEKLEMADDHDLCVSRVRSIQNSHMDGNGWTDIGYNLLVCSHRSVFVGRGGKHLPAANGPGLNSGHYAVCGLVGNSGLVVPSDDMLLGILDAIAYLRQTAGAGTQIKGHRDGYATDCPGTRLYQWVKDGCPKPSGGTPQPPKPQPSAPDWPGRYFEFESGADMVHGTDVEKWQRQMKARGWHLVVDGWYGPNSAGACRAMQGNLDLWEDGIVGPVTWRATWVAPIA